MLSYVHYPDFSPDGTQIVFTLSDNSINSGIWIVNTNGTDLRQLTDVGRFNRAVLSPDGSKIAFDNLQEIMEINIDKTGLRTLTSTPRNVLWSTYSQDGQEIYFTMYKEGGGGLNDIHKVNVNTLLSEQITDGSIFFRSPEVTTNGLKIIYTRQERDGVTGNAIMSMNLDGTDQKIIYSGNVREATVSPDNEKIAFSGNGKLYIMNFDGTDVHEIYSGGNNSILDVSWGTYPDDDSEMMDIAQNSSSSQTQGDITIYPNPVIDILTIDHLNSDIKAINTSILVFDSQAQPVDEINTHHLI